MNGRMNSHLQNNRAAPDRLRAGHDLTESILGPQRLVVRGLAVLMPLLVDSKAERAGVFDGVFAILRTFVNHFHIGVRSTVVGHDGVGGTGRGECDEAGEQYETDSHGINGRDRAPTPSIKKRKACEIPRADTRESNAASHCAQALRGCQTSVSRWIFAVLNSFSLCAAKPRHVSSHGAGPWRASTG